MFTRSEPALWQLDDTYEGFDWIDFHDADNSVVSFLRKSRDGDIVAFVVNATPVVRYNYRLGVPEPASIVRSSTPTPKRMAEATSEILAVSILEDVPWMGREHSILIQFAAAGDAGV